MRYLIIAQNRTPLPPEMALGILGAVSAWSEGYVAAGKIEQTWGFAGLQAGGGILNVASAEELDEVMAQFPLAPFSKVEIFGLVDLGPALERGKQAITAMFAAGGLQ